MGQLKGSEEATLAMSDSSGSHDHVSATDDNRDVNDNLVRRSSADNVLLPDLLRDIGASPPSHTHSSSIRAHPQSIATPAASLTQSRSVSCQVQQKHLRKSQVKRTRTGAERSRRSTKDRSNEPSANHTANTPKLHSGLEGKEISLQDQKKLWKMRNLAAQMDLSNDRMRTKSTEMADCHGQVLMDMLNKNVGRIHSKNDGISAASPEDAWFNPHQDKVRVGTGVGVSDFVTNIVSGNEQRLMTPSFGLSKSPDTVGMFGRSSPLVTDSSSTSDTNDSPGLSPVLTGPDSAAQTSRGAGEAGSTSDFYPELIATYTQIATYDGKFDAVNRSRALALLQTSGCYYGRLSMQEARRKLKRSAVGTFLVRDSSDPHYFLALSVKTQRGTTAIRISYSRGRFRLDCDEKALLRMHSFDCVLKLLQYYNHATAKGKNQSCVFLESTGRKDTPVVLTQPYLEKPQSLKHMCRGVLNRVLTEEQRSRLLIFMAPDIEDYLLQYPYFI